MGIALVDLSQDALERLLPRAFEHSLPLLQVSLRMRNNKENFCCLKCLRVPKVLQTSLKFQGEEEIYEGVNARPCLTIEQRSSVRSNLKRVFRYK